MQEAAVVASTLLLVASVQIRVPIAWLVVPFVFSLSVFADF